MARHALNILCVSERFTCIMIFFMLLVISSKSEVTLQLQYCLIVKFETTTSFFQDVGRSRSRSQSVHESPARSDHSHKKSHSKSRSYSRSRSRSRSRHHHKRRRSYSRYCVHFSLKGKRMAVSSQGGYELVKKYLV